VSLADTRQPSYCEDPTVNLGPLPVSRCFVLSLNLLSKFGIKRVIMLMCGVFKIDSFCSFCIVVSPVNLTDYWALLCVEFR